MAGTKPVLTGTSGSSGKSGVSGTSGTSGASGTSGTSGSSGLSGTAGTGGVAWGNIDWTLTNSSNSPPSTTLSYYTTSWPICGSTYTTSSVYYGPNGPEGPAGVIGIGTKNPTSRLEISPTISSKHKSVALNVNNMKGIDLRRQIKSKKVSASQCV